MAQIGAKFVPIVPEGPGICTPSAGHISHVPVIFDLLGGLMMDYCRDTSRGKIVCSPGNSERGLSRPTDASGERQIVLLPGQLNHSVRNLSEFGIFFGLGFS